MPLYEKKSSLVPGLILERSDKLAKQQVELDKTEHIVTVAEGFGSFVLSWARFVGNESYKTMFIEKKKQT